MRPAVFLDRDGVLNRRRWTLVRRLGQLEILPGVARSVARLTEAGLPVFVATNQDWVGAGYVAREEHDAIMAAVLREMEREGGRVEAAYACLHAPWTGCDDRKPKPGMLLAAAREHGVDLARSFMVGDNLKDMLAGRAAGARTVLVDPRLRTRLQRAAAHADHVCRDLGAATAWILGQPRSPPPLH